MSLGGADAGGDESAAGSGRAGEDQGADDLLSLGQRLFEDFAPAEVEAQYEFPTRAQFDAFLGRLTAALEGESLGELAAYVPEAKAALATLRAVPGQEDFGGLAGAAVG
jgi:membrane-bound lytic murein transglycosylase D